ncbi:uncharacterized protein H6S33_010252 [Morchella sextelata]|uniref:uncharacterized protein n=1 Tax=Morchella sextelata TaxID=1174677 RepID=UPI001D04B1F6|nr:uncharacterized protein H6S33_010252 [Morchella sextelata]KAH0612200.1 hypothetical protein H6S33_010252 [Morchella sextelata]
MYKLQYMILIPTKHDIRSTGAMGLKIKRCGVYPKEVLRVRDTISPEPSNTLFEHFIMALLPVLVIRRVG